MKKWIISVIIILILFFSMSSKSVDTKETKKKTKIQEIVLKKQSLTLTIETTGKVVSNLDVGIKCKASGEITKLPKDISEWVKTGELIMELDPIDEERQVKKSEISLNSSIARLNQSRHNLKISQMKYELDKKMAEINLDAAKKNAVEEENKLERTRKLLKKKIVSQEEYERDENNAIQAKANEAKTKINLDEFEYKLVEIKLKEEEIKKDEAQVEQNKINLALAKRRLSETKVYSPIDGIIVNRNVQTGQIISSGISNVGGGTTIMTISDFSRIFIEASVDESDIGKIEPGQEVNVTVDAFRNKNFIGEVIRISPRGTTSSNVVTFEVRIEITGKNKKLLKPEMTANVEIVIADKNDVIAVPNGALFRVKRRQLILVKNGDKIEEKKVKIGVSTATHTEIVKGLKLGDKIVIDPSKSQSKWKKRQRGFKRGLSIFSKGKKKK